MDDIIFEGRNKLYGAYQLRQLVDRHSAIGLFVTLSMFAVLALIGMLNLNNVMQHHAPIVITVHPTNILMPVNIEKPKPVAQKEIPKVNTVKSEVLNVVENTTAPAPVKQEELVKFQPSTETHNEPNNTNTSTPVEKPVASLNTGTAIEKTVEKISTPVNYAEEMPSFPGGKAALNDYLKNGIVPFQSDVQTGNTGKVIVRFYIDTDGSVRNPEVLKDNMGGRCAEVALNAIRKMPKWKPGKQGDKLVKVYYVLPISFDFSRSGYY